MGGLQRLCESLLARQIGLSTDVISHSQFFPVTRADSPHRRSFTFMLVDPLAHGIPMQKRLRSIPFAAAHIVAAMLVSIGLLGPLPTVFAGDDRSSTSEDVTSILIRTLYQPASPSDRDVPDEEDSDWDDSETTDSEDADSIDLAPVSPSDKLVSNANDPPAADSEATLEVIPSVTDGTLNADLSIQQTEPNDCTLPLVPAQFEIYELSVRHRSCDPCRLILDDSVFDVYQWVNCSQWVRGDIQSAMAAQVSPDSQEPLTIIYAHGNFMERCNARNRAFLIANQIAMHSHRPFRMLMLSWPSEKERRPLKDTYRNTQCSDTIAFYLGYLLRRLPPTEQVSIHGFSLGARVVTGGLHLDAGGCLIGRQLSNFPSVPPQSANHATEHQYRVSLIAPAIDQSWLQQNNRMGLAMTEVAKLVNLYNSNDPVLRRYFFSDLSSRPLAAGFAGFVGITDPRPSSPLAGQDRVFQYDCSRYLRNTHDERSYYRQCPAYVLAIRNLLWNPL